MSYSPLLNDEGEELTITDGNFTLPLATLIDILLGIQNDPKNKGCNITAHFMEKYVGDGQFQDRIGYMAFMKEDILWLSR
jgi:hypothetical protein